MAISRDIFIEELVGFRMVFLVNACKLTKGTSGRLILINLCTHMRLKCFWRCSEPIRFDYWI